MKLKRGKIEHVDHTSEENRGVASAGRKREATCGGAGLSKMSP